jgi:hypothetical protein
VFDLKHIFSQTTSLKRYIHETMLVLILGEKKKLEIIRLVNSGENWHVGNCFIVAIKLTIFTFYFCL